MSAALVEKSWQATLPKIGAVRGLLTALMVAVAAVLFNAPASADTTSEAAQAWSAAKETTSTAVLESFIRHYPDTFYADLARARLEELRKNPAQAESLPSEAPTNKTQPPKMPDRFNPSTSDNVAPEVQRAVLYVENPSNPKGDQYAGSVTWHSEPNWTSGKMDVGMRADVEIPDRKLKLTLSLRRNTDPSEPASHIIELTFDQPKENPDGNISLVPGIMMKTAEQAKGIALEGIVVKVVDGFFLMGIATANRESNLQVLKQLSWFDIPIVYGNGLRAIVTFEKGATGTQIFNDAFAAWKQ